MHPRGTCARCDPLNGLLLTFRFANIGELLVFKTAQLLKLLNCAPDHRLLEDGVYGCLALRICGMRRASPQPSIYYTVPIT